MSGEPAQTTTTPAPDQQPQRAGAGQVGAASLRIIIALLAAILIVTSLLLSRQMWPKWEYAVEGVHDLSFDRSMERLGEEGWELVFARRAMDGDGDPLYEMILKRPR